MRWHKGLWPLGLRCVRKPPCVGTAVTVTPKSGVLESQAHALRIFQRLDDGQFVALGDRRLAAQLPPERAMVPAEKAGELRLPARTALIVERNADDPQVGGGYALCLSPGDVAVAG